MMCGDDRDTGDGAFARNPWPEQPPPLLPWI